MPSQGVADTDPVPDPVAVPVTEPVTEPVPVSGQALDANAHSVNGPVADPVADTGADPADEPTEGWDDSNRAARQESGSDYASKWDDDIMVFSVQADLARLQFKNNTVSGSSSNIVLGISLQVSPYLEFGYSDSGGLTLDPSIELASGGELADGDDVLNTGVQSLHVRARYPFSEGFSGFLQFGFSKLEVSTTDVTVCLFIDCGGDLTTGETVYSFEENSKSIGIGLELELDRDGAIVLQATDYAAGEDFEFDTVQIGYKWNWEFNRPDWF